MKQQQETIYPCRNSKNLVRAILAVFFSVLLPVTSASAARVALYVTGGVNSETILAAARAIAATGHTVYCISNDDIEQGRLTTTNFDVLILPQGQDGTKTYYTNTSEGLGSTTSITAIQNFVAGGGGFIGIEAGAHFASSGGLKLYTGTYTPATTPEGAYSYTIADSAFGSGSQYLYISSTGGYFPTPSSPDGSTSILTNSLGSRSAVRCTYGSGLVILTAPNPTLRGDSELDWTQWDNWVMGSTHTDSVGAWQLFGRMINWVYSGTADLPDISSSNQSGRHVAIVTSYISTSPGYHGGAWPGLLPAVGRAVDDSGHVPLAIRFQDIINGLLTVDTFGAVVFPGGNSTGYETGLSGHEDKIRDYVSNGGCYFGICAGSYYGSSTYNWDGTEYDPDLNLFSGQDTGPIEDLSEDPAGHLWTYWTITPITINDEILGNIGTQNQFYFGGGYKTEVTGVAAAATYAKTDSTSYGKTDAVRFTYGQGRVLLSGAHPEARSGSDEDWLYWDNYSYKSTTPLTNPDNPWLFVNAVS